MRRKLLTLILLVVLVLAGCKAMDAFLGYDHDTGQVDPDNATIEKVEEIGEGVGVLIPGASIWVELGAGILTAVGGAYIAIRRFQRKKASSLVAASGTKKGSGGKTT